jgi:uncharacterized protein (DUF1684 family)
MTDRDAHERVVEAWRSARYAALRREIGWLTLAGLDWLRPGENRIGSDPELEVTLPAGPSLAGSITVSGDRLSASGLFTHDGGAVEDLPLADDSAGEPTMLELGDLRFCVIQRGGRHAVRTWNTRAPALRDFAGIDHWPVDPAWRIDARFEPSPGRMVAVPDVLGFIEEEESPGEVVFDVDGRQHGLQALPGGPNGELWLVFGDATNGIETYGGGRFLYTAAPVDGSVEVDFNRAYNPPCVFSPFATCPLPWPENRLPIRVEAGERSFHIG